MDSNLERIFLDHSIQKLNQYAGRIDTCVRMLTAEQVWARGNANENAIGNLVLHLCGNVRQWIVSAVGNRPDVRQRETEFAARGGVPVDELMARLRGTVEEAAATITAVTGAQMAERRRIQGYDVTVMEAIYHVVEHFAMHAGQIIFITKMRTAAPLDFRLD